MKLVNPVDWLRDAKESGYAVPALNTQGGNYNLVRTVVEIAKEQRSPIILMAYEANTAYYGLEWLPFLAKRMAEQYDLPLSVHLDHGAAVDSVVKAVDAGYTSVMIDYSKRPLEENIEATTAVINAARPRSVAVEAELGELLRNDGSVVLEDAKNLVNPDQVQRFLDACRVDMLAVGIGNAHGFYKGTPNIRIDLLKRVESLAGETALVLHGTTGIPESTVKECIRHGMVKINFGTILRTRFLQYVEEELGRAADHRGHIWRVEERAHDRLKDEVRTIISLLGSNNRL